MAGLNRAKLNREILEMQRRQFRERLGELRGLITAARAAKKAAIKAVQVDCAAQRAALRERCAARALEERTEGSKRVAAGRANLKEEQQFEKRTRAASRPPRQRSTARERAQESDDAVRSNLSAELVPVFNQVKKHIKGGPRKTRTEAFLEWVHENPDEVFTAMAHDADRWLASLLAEQAQTQERYKRTARARGPVPF